MLILIYEKHLIPDIKEGIRFNDDEEFVFDYNNDQKDDIIKLKYSKGYIGSRTTKGLVSFFSYKINKTYDKNIRIKLLTHIKLE